MLLVQSSRDTVFNTPQDDIVMGTLSVRENLSFSAALRLNMSSKGRSARVDKVIRELGLESCADTKVGLYARGPSV